MKNKKSSLLTVAILMLMAISTQAQNLLAPAVSSIKTGTYLMLNSSGTSVTMEDFTSQPFDPEKIDEYTKWKFTELMLQGTGKLTRYIGIQNAETKKWLHFNNAYEWVSDEKFLSLNERDEEGNPKVKWEEHCKYVFYPEIIKDEKTGEHILFQVRQNPDKMDRKVIHSKLVLVSLD